MEKLFKIPILTRMYQARSEELEKYINNSTENISKLDNMEQKLKGILNFVQGEHYNFVESQIDDVLMEIQEFANLWNEQFYRLGVVDAERLKEEIKQEKEKVHG